ncbi:hypothetical protein [Streptomyces sp. NPDC006645]
MAGDEGREEGGEPPCMLELVCEECGRLNEDPAPVVCAECGSALARPA